MIHIDGYTLSLNKRNEELCGDMVKIKHTGDSFIMALADGLGSGVKANILATLTSTIFSEMLEAGMELWDAVETITATLPQCQERQIAYSTFAVLQVNYNGNTKIYEFDTPQTIIIRRNQLLDIPSDSITIGNRTIIQRSFKALPDDLIICLSDGIINAGVGKILNFGFSHEAISQQILKTYRNGDQARTVAQNILYLVNDLYDGAPGDDATVAVARIVREQKATVMVGPPADPQYDQEVVNRLMRTNGLRIVCGGTTAQIVSRLTKQEIIMPQLISIVNDVPPTAQIRHIDLVTEGVLTLGKVARHLAEGAKSKDYLEQLLDINPEDGALKMVQMLLTTSTSITFLVGRADNPAHQSIAYSPISLSSKIKLINKIAENLRILGKLITIELY
jgi:hypothetical protein